MMSGIARGRRQTHFPSPRGLVIPSVSGLAYPGMSRAGNGSIIDCGGSSLLNAEQIREALEDGLERQREIRARERYAALLREIAEELFEPDSEPIDAP